MSASGLYSQDLSYAKEIIEKLSSPELKGRGYAGKGDRLAADFIESEFRRLGLLPLEGKSYFEKFSVKVNTFPGRMSVTLGENVLIPGKDFIVGASTPSVKGKFHVISITRDELRTEDDLISIVGKASGSFILLDNRGRKNEDAATAKKTDELADYLKSAWQIPAKGIIIFTDEKLTMEISDFQGPRPVIIVSGQGSFLPVKEINVDITAVLKNKYITRNIEGYIKGVSGSDSTIFLTSHYDHLGLLGSNTYFPGANDNASGVAMMLNLAEHYSKVPPKYNTVFVSFSAEELGILGAQAFISDPPADLSKIKFLINFDLAGTGEEGIRVVNGSVFKDKFDRLVNLNSENSLLPKIDIRGAACISDHCVFYQKGVPCFYIYTQGGIQAYHDIYDRFDTLPLTEFTDYCRLMLLFIGTF